MDEKIAKLKEWIDGSDNIVFSAVRAYRPRAAFRISARWTVYTTSSTSTRRRPFSATRSFERNRGVLSLLSGENAGS